MGNKIVNVSGEVVISILGQAPPSNVPQKPKGNPFTVNPRSTIQTRNYHPYYDGLYNLTLIQNSGHVFAVE